MLVSIYVLRACIFFCERLKIFVDGAEAVWQSLIIETAQREAPPRWRMKMKLFQIEAKYENMTKTVRAATRAQAIAQVAKETGIDPKTLFSRSL